MPLHQTNCGPPFGTDSAAMADARLVMFVLADGRTNMLKMLTPLSEKLDITLFATATHAAMTVRFTRCGPAHGQWVVYEEVGFQVKV
jgi:hypothetical protein